MNKSLCCVIHSLGVGGMERVMSILINDFYYSKNMDVHVIFIGKKPQVFYKIPDKIKLHFPDFEFDNFKRYHSIFKTILFLRNRVKKINPVAVLSFGEIWNNLVLLSLLAIDTKVFVSDRSKPSKNIGFFNEFLRRLFYPKASGLIVQTQYAKDRASLLGYNNNICVIPNPIYSLNKKAKCKNNNIVLSVGRLIDTKNYDRLIKMFIELNPHNWRLVIVGGDSMPHSNYNSLNRLISDLGATDKVCLAGLQSNTLDYYLEASIFAFTSSSEGFPNVLGEALSAGLPVISYDCEAGPSEIIINDYNGYLVDLFDDESFKERLSFLINDRKLRQRMSDNALKSIAKYDSKIICNKFYNFILG